MAIADEYKISYGSGSAGSIYWVYLFPFAPNVYATLLCLWVITCLLFVIPAAAKLKLSVEASSETC